MIYTKKEIETLIYIKNNNCREIHCTDCPLNKKQCSSKKIVKSILDESRYLARKALKNVIYANLHKKRN